VSLLDRCSENVTKMFKYIVERPYAYLAIPSFLAGVLLAAFLILPMVRRFSVGTNECVQ